MYLLLLLMLFKMFATMFETQRNVFMCSSVATSGKGKSTWIKLKLKIKHCVNRCKQDVNTLFLCKTFKQAFSRRVYLEKQPNEINVSSPAPCWNGLKSCSRRFCEVCEQSTCWLTFFKHYIFVLEGHFRHCTAQWHCPEISRNKHTHTHPSIRT